MHKDEIIKSISRRSPDIYSTKEAEAVAEEIIKAEPNIQAGIKKYLETGEIDNIKVKNYSVQSFTDLKITPLAAFLNLDWLIKNPDEAEAAFRKGSDRIEGLAHSTKLKN